MKIQGESDVVAVVHEAIHYCETHQDLLKFEAEEERYRLQEKGVSLEPTITVAIDQ
ncbi:MAG: hypothetical protein ACFBSC_22260 [Microcoleaceae cyanobacterium]